MRKGIDDSTTPPSRLFPTAPRDTATPAHPCNASLIHPGPSVQTAFCRATPCCEPRRATAAPSSRHHHHGRGGAAGG
jgi:hypothetical protein